MIDVRRLRALVLVFLLGAGALQAANLSTAFTYQGRLNVSAAPYTGTCDFSFTLWDAVGSGSPPTGGSQVGSPVVASAVSVTAGLFTTTIDFGVSAFPAQDRWLQVAVGCPSGMATTPLAPRQQVTPEPYALALPYLRSPSGTASPNVVGGYSGNAADAGSSGITIAGGGAVSNTNLGQGDYATVSGGSKNHATAPYSTIAGGNNNYIGGNYSVIGGGQNNWINPQLATISGGLGNLADGLYSMIPGGDFNHAAGDRSFAAGHRAKANNIGDFVWADSNDFDFSAGTDNRFRVRATGGIQFVVGIDSGTGATTWSCVVTNMDASWSCSSDRNAKENFEAIDGADVLEKVGRLSILKWNAKGAEPSVKHVGPMAQDFRAAFGLGSDDKMISTIDLEGVALAAIQGAKVQIEALEAKNAQLEERLRALECALEAGR